MKKFSAGSSRSELQEMGRIMILMIPPFTLRAFISATVSVRSFPLATLHRDGSLSEGEQSVVQWKITDKAAVC